MNAKQLFTHTMVDLRRRVDQPEDEYDLLMAAALLRKLLLDESPLVHQVNRELKMKLTFEVATLDAYEALVLEAGPAAYLVSDGISPRAAVPAAVVQAMKLDSFLAAASPGVV